MRRNIVIVVIAVLLIGIAIVSNASKETLPQEVAAKAGFLAPNMKLTTIDDREYTFDHANLQKPVLINFWASWCGPCANEAPALAELHAKYRDKVDFLAVNATTWEFQGERKVTEFVEKYNWQMPVLLDEDGSAIKSYNVIGIPITVLVSQNGVIEYIFEGEFQPEELDRRLARL
jgi:thiol-disulfide isomerase/thioredoxin